MRHETEGWFPAIMRTGALLAVALAACGLYDCHGNVAEWCIDRYVKWENITDDILQNGSLTASADNHLLKGSSWPNGAGSMFIDRRDSESQGTSSSANGWRAYCPAD